MILHHHNKAWKLIFSCCIFLILSLQAKANQLIVPGNDTLFIEQCDSFIPPTATAYDSSLNVVNGADISISYSPSLNTCVLDLYKINYTWKDSAGNTIVSKIKYLFIIPDTTSPLLVIHGGKQNSFGQLEDFVAVFENYTPPQATAQDHVDGNLSASISVNSNVNPSVVGTYTVTYSVTDFANNKIEKILYVIVGDTIAPVVTLNGKQHDTIYAHYKYNDPGASASDNYDDSITVISGGGFYSNFPNSIPTMAGTYTIVYTVTDFSGNTASAQRYITVIDTLYDIRGYITLGNINSAFHRNATIYLIKFDISDSTLTAVNTYNITPGNGSFFTFPVVPAGDYLIKAALDSTDSLYADYLPTYYSNSLTWSGATTLTLTELTSVFDIELIAGTNTGGSGFISGKVSQGANKKEGDPLENIQIILTTADDKPVAYTYSDENGYFEFTNLALGKHKIFGEVPGKKAYDRNINLTEDYPSHTNISVMVNSTTVYVNFETLSIADPETATFTNIYPNPATDKIYIHTNGKNRKQKIMLYNTAGKLVQAQIFSAAQNAVLEVSQLPKGMYFLQLEYNNQTSERRKIIIAH